MTWQAHLSEAKDHSNPGIAPALQIICRDKVTLAHTGQGAIASARTWVLGLCCQSITATCLAFNGQTFLWAQICQGYLILSGPLQATYSVMYNIRKVQHIQALWFANCCNTNLWWVYTKAIYRSLISAIGGNGIKFKTTAKVCNLFSFPVAPPIAWSSISPYLSKTDNSDSPLLKRTFWRIKQKSHA